MDVNSNTTAVVNEMEQEDIICDYPDDCTQDEQDEKIIGDDDNLLKIVAKQEDDPSGQEIQNITVEASLENLDVLIEQLPDQFPAASDTIKNKISPLLIDCDAGIKDHYVKVIKKKTNAASIKSVSLLVEEAIEKGNSEKTEPDEEDQEVIQTDPEITALADQIAQDPLLFKKRIDLVNQLGVIGEQKTIGLYSLIIDSALLPLGAGGSEALAAKNSGPYGSGKSYPMLITLKIYPKSAYRLITNGSAKSLYNLKDGLKHKTLILTEALSLQGTKGDNELAYAIRSLVSEGFLTYQYTGFAGKEKVTITQNLDGPTSLLTTTIRGKLEEQLEDRLVQIHPNSSDNQTQAIISQTAEIASGMQQPIDEKLIKAWKLFRKNLESVDVVIPFAPDISDFVNRGGSLPISARRAFKRVLSAIKTIALIHQKQRARDDMGRVIAEYYDYALAYQLTEGAYMESIGNGKRYTDNRIKIIEKYGKIMPKDLAKLIGITGAAISQWTKPLLKKGVLMWVDDADNTFADVESLEKAKRSGKAYIKVGQFNRLPTPFELTGNPDWNNEGELYRQYDLGFESTDTDVLGLDEGEQSSLSLNISDDSYDIENKEETEDSTEGVNALRLIPHQDFMKMAAEFRASQKQCDPNDPETISLCDGFNSILAKDNVSTIN